MFVAQKQALILIPKWHFLKRNKVIPGSVSFFLLHVFAGNVNRDSRDSVHTWRNRTGNVPCSHSIATGTSMVICPSLPL